jgi:hypothetical protein
MSHDEDRKLSAAAILIALCTAGGVWLGMRIEGLEGLVGGVVGGVLGFFRGGYLATTMTSE